MRSITAWLVLLALIVPMQPVWGWGETGHRIVGRLAAARITDPAVRARILAVLDQDTEKQCAQPDLADRLACVSIWADAVRRTTMRSTSNWHFVNIPIGEASYEAGRDCKLTPRGDCIIQAIERQRALLLSGRNTATPEAKAEAVKFIVHLVGDLSQPLHCVTDNDAGGNSKTVTWFGESAYTFGHWNLHAVWDDGILDRSTAPKEEPGGFARDVAYAEVLLHRQPVSSSGPFASSKLIAWAVEGHGIAIQIYSKLPAPQQGRLEGPENTDRMFYTLGSRYEANSLNVVELQLQRAGQRLADVLNDIFGQTPTA